MDRYSNSNHSLVYGGTTTRTPGSFNGYNDIGWIESNWPYSSSSIAVNTWWFDASLNSNIIYESDISVNGVNFTWSTTGQSGRMDVQNILTHELGHALNLQDLYGDNDDEKTMYGYSSTGETKQRTLETEDIAGVVYLYPTPFSLILKNNFEFDGENNGQISVRNVTQATNSVPYNSPINRTVNYGTTFEFTALSQQTVSGRTYNFAGWIDGNGDNPRTVTPIGNTTTTALYKYPNHTNTSTTYTANNQRRIVKAYNGSLHKVYESMGKVWYETSTDDGSTWTIMNNGQPLYSGNAKSPAITVDAASGFNEVIIVFQKENAGGNSELVVN